jgi:hypothetical protein
MRRKVVIALAIVVVAALLLAPRVRRFLAIDGCLDHGGAWNYERDTCEGARPEG